MKTKICECGHEKKDHKKGRRFDINRNFNYCVGETGKTELGYKGREVPICCPCKKFKVVNTSQTKPFSGAEAVYARSVRKKDKTAEKTKEWNLSKKGEERIMSGISYREKDVKEFVRRVKI